MAASIVVTVRCVEHALHKNGNSYLQLVNDCSPLAGTSRLPPPLEGSALELSQCWLTSSVSVHGAVCRGTIVGGYNSVCVWRGGTTVCVYVCRYNSVCVGGGGYYSVWGYRQTCVCILLTVIARCSHASCKRYSIIELKATIERYSTFLSIVLFPFSLPI